MLKLASLSLVALLSLASPVLAKKTVKPEHKVCTTPEMVTETAPAGIKFDQKLEGDALKKLMTNTDHPNTDVDFAMLFDREEGSYTIFITFKAGCLKGVGSFPTKNKGRLLGTDNTI